MTVKHKGIDAGTVIVGGGLAGLTAAVWLAGAGHRVTVLEKAGRAGGRAATVRKEGVSFNLGPHALYKGGEAYRTYRRLGLLPSGGTPPLCMLGLWKGAAYPMPVSVGTLLKAKLLSWTGKFELASFLSGLGRLDPSSAGGASLREWAEGRFRDPMVRHYLYALSRTWTFRSDVSALRAETFLRQARHSVVDGVHYIDGGWQTLVDGLKEAAERAGARVLTGTAAVRIEREDGEARRVRCADGTAFDASAVIAAVPPAAACKLVEGGEPAAALEAWSRQARPVTVAALDIALRRAPEPGRNLAVGLDTPVFFSAQSLGAKMADDGILVATLAKYADASRMDPARDEADLEAALDVVVPGWRGQVVRRQFLPRLTAMYETRPAGSPAPWIGPEVPGIRGLYVAGDWAGHGEELADAAVASAARAVQAIAESSGGSAAADRIVSIGG
ncbi:phytoene desaturase family protein [Paenibacillus flagellatus]|uniref:Dehydrogenase n=1 Tax=Paenibacillus flagellatus TaxID=2211139 RepID=A0A2V5KIT3_9BACL|nr:FAD-dependent oxidoreductase [Paenibacillus flagellatus]PYI54440.1 dehydrogenase [Paenibacillus flagellatus]